MMSRLEGGRCKAFCDNRAKGVGHKCMTEGGGGGGLKLSKFAWPHNSLTKTKP